MKMKKILFSLLTIFILIVVVACGKKEAPTDYLLHVDSETGVPAARDGGVAAAEEFFKTQTVEFDWTYTGEQLQNK